MKRFSLGYKVFFIFLILILFFLFRYSSQLAIWAGIDTRIHSIIVPRFFQVIQRDVNGSAQLNVEAEIGMRVKGIDYALSKNGNEILPDAWRNLNGDMSFRSFSGKIQLAEGWTTLFFRSYNSDHEYRLFDGVKVGVGDIFVVAGQSNAAGESQTLNVSTTGMVSVAYFKNGRLEWKPCNDPQTAGGGGSVWPIVGDSLVKLFKVPVGFINIAKGGSSVNDWLPGTDNYNNLLYALKANHPNGVKAILWHQGEQDALMSTEEYYTKMKMIIAKLKVESGYSQTWLVSAASYSRSKVFENIRSAQKKLWADEYVQPGPDTDSLGKVYREEDDVHLNKEGNDMAARMWVSQILTIY